MIRVAVMGASGYTGVELLRLLSRHPHVEITAVTSRQHEGEPISTVFPSLYGVVDLLCVNPPAHEVAQVADLVFTALPHKAAMDVVPDLLAGGCRVVDLSADFRLRDVSVYESWYQAHACPELVESAVYGLPELFRDDISSSKLIANPGCYPTSAALALAPLFEQECIDFDSVIIDSKSGTSGAGRAAKVGSLFCEVNEAFKAYGVTSHRHTPEIEQTLSRVCGEEIQVTFTPHLLPVNRGILSTCYAQLKQEMSLDKIRQAYLDKYSSEPFVRFLPEGSFPDISYVRGSNYCDIGIALDARRSRVIAIAAIDNLIKGAAGQAIQNMNLMLDFPEDTGLLQLPLSP